MKTVVAGHSLGSSIANYIGSKDDQIIGLNGGYTIGQKLEQIQQIIGQEVI